MLKYDELVNGRLKVRHFGTKTGRRSENRRLTNTGTPQLPKGAA
jgi:hypothetical protein